MAFYDRFKTSKMLPSCFKWSCCNRIQWGFRSFCF